MAGHVWPSPQGCMIRQPVVIQWKSSSSVFTIRSPCNNIASYVCLQMALLIRSTVVCELFWVIRVMLELDTGYSAQYYWYPIVCIQPTALRHNNQTCKQLSGGIYKEGRSTRGAPETYGTWTKHLENFVDTFVFVLPSVWGYWLKGRVALGERCGHNVHTDVIAIISDNSKWLWRKREHWTKGNSLPNDSLSGQAWVFPVISRADSEVDSKVTFA